MASNKKSDNSQEGANTSTKPKVELIEDLLRGLDQEGEEDSNQQPLKGEGSAWGNWNKESAWSDSNNELHKSMNELYLAYEDITIDGDPKDPMEQFHRSST
jgi:hypothetical protein